MVLGGCRSFLLLVTSKQAATSPQATTLPIPNFKFFTGSVFNFSIKSK